MEKENEYTLIEVGEVSPFVEEYKKAMMQDCVLFGATENGQGYTHMVFNKRFTEDEVDAIIRAKVRVRVIQNAEDFVLMMFKFGSYDLIHEISFDPTLYPDARALQLANDNNLVTIFCIERMNNKVLGIRQANLPLKLIQLCRISWSKALLQSDYTERYNRWYQELQKKYSTKQLWSMGIDVGYLGESYNLEEVAFPFHE